VTKSFLVLFFKKERLPFCILLFSIAFFTDGHSGILGEQALQPTRLFSPTPLAATKEFVAFHNELLARARPIG
jgi:hypothetical protein